MYCVYRSRIINFKVTSEKILGDAITEKPVIESQQVCSSVLSSSTVTTNCNNFESFKFTSCIWFCFLNRCRHSHNRYIPFLKLAFTKQYAVSEALLAKIAWKIFTKPNSLLTRILLSKY
ncbi:unnamed protein product [Brassica rapa]|uniref:Uncharacterized protein n=1 Tax=Brassica campestris TaxID=3711 RepID=A0A3P5YL66_BRACM|nr:unnamed protein product [Brassica rapa]VDC68402.1 unnamed protein product [Brassica rapa]